MNATRVFKGGESVVVAGKDARYVGPNFEKPDEVFVQYRNHRTVSVKVADIVTVIEVGNGYIKRDGDGKIVIESQADVDAAMLAEDAVIAAEGMTPDERLRATMERIQNEAEEHRMTAKELGYDKGDYVRLPKGKATFRVDEIIGEVVLYTEIGGRWKMTRIGDEAKRYVKVEHERCTVCGDDDHTTAGHASVLDAIPNDLED